MNIYEELKSLRREIAILKQEKAAFETQRQLLEHLVFMARTPQKENVLNVILKSALELSAKLTKAEKCGMLLFDASGQVTESILTRGEVTQEERTNIINSVLKKGLAGWVKHHRQVGLILDTEQDERWLTLPNQPYAVRSALAVPILWDENLLGLITLLHSHPGHFDHEATELIQKTADQVALVLENARLYGKLEEFSQFLNLELNKGKEIQQGFLPSQIPQPPNWEIATSFYPARQVAGDFYDVFELPGNYVGLVIADVCDKGVGAALFMGLFRSLIRIFSGQTNLKGLSVVDIDSAELASTEIGNLFLEEINNVLESHEEIDLEQLKVLKAIPLTNNYVAQNHWSLSMFATVFFGVLNPETGWLSYINGGHETLYLVNDSGIKQSLKSTGPAVGMMPNAKFGIRQVQLHLGDILVGYSDGVTDAKSPNGKLFTEQRLRILLEQPTTSASDLLERIKTHIFTHIDNALQFDDITMLAVGRRK